MLISYNHDIAKTEFANKKDEAKARILVLLENFPDQKFPKKVLKEGLDIGERTFDSALKELIDSGKISSEGQTKDKLFFITPNKLNNNS